MRGWAWARASRKICPLWSRLFHYSTTLIISQLQSPKHFSSTPTPTPTPTSVSNEPIPPSLVTHHVHSPTRPETHFPHKTNAGAPKPLTKPKPLAHPSAAHNPSAKPFPVCSVLPSPTPSPGPSSVQAAPLPRKREQIPGRWFLIINPALAFRNPWAGCVNHCPPRTVAH